MEATKSTPVGAMNEDLTSMLDQNPVENDREFKAHIYQQLTDLQPYLSAESQIAVLVSEEEADDDEETGTEYVLTLVATFGEYRLEAEGRDTNLYEAFGLAKKAMLSQIEEWYSLAVDTTERDAQIQSVIEGGYMVH